MKPTQVKFVNRERRERHCMIYTGKKRSFFKLGISLVGALVLHTAVVAFPKDSTKATLIINPRLHSAGYFPFTGAMLNHNPVADVNIFAEKKKFGFFLFQSVDLADRHSYVNYFQPGIFATFRFRPNFRLRTFFGYIFSQTQGFRDPDSDYYTAGMITWDVSRKFRIENTALLYDVTIQKKYANRLLLSYTQRKFKAELFVWNRLVIEENLHAVSASVALTGPALKLGNKASVLFTAAYMRYLTEYRPSFALADGFLFTMAVPVNVLP